MTENGLQVHILGEITVFRDGQRIDVPGSRKTRALLGFLLLQNRPVTRERLCDLLWPHPDNPRAALRWSLTKLRPVLNTHTEHLQADRTSVSVVGLSDEVDLRRVEDLLRKPIEDIGTAELEAAAGLYHGELLEGMEIPDCHSFNEWLIARAETARRSRRRILEALTVRLAEDPEAALVHARARVSLNPLDEGAHVDVVRLLTALGRAPEAQSQADRCRRILDVELGERPGPELEAALEKAPAHSPREPMPVMPPIKAITNPTAAGLFGRAEECIRLEGFLDSSPARPLLLLEGEPGIGKSRLLSELKRRAEDRDFLVLEGRSWEVEMVRPFGIWIDLLGELPHEAIPMELRGDLAPLIPSLGEPLPSAGALEPLITAVTRLFEHLTEGGRTVVAMFDDIHWIDQASAELLQAVTPTISGPDFGIAFAGRPGEFAENDAARSLVRAWNRAGRLARIRIEPLGTRDSAALARAFSNRAEVDEVVEACGGNPLYLIESMRDGAAPGSDGVTSLVADRLAVLDEPTRAIADWAAVIGRDFPAARMAALVELPLTELLTRSEILERHGILRSHGDGWDFAHDLLRRATLGELSGPRRALMHRHIAKVMLTEIGAEGPLAGEITFHARHGGNPELAADFAVKAGDRALRMAAFEDAWRIADRGLLEVDKLPASSRIPLHVELLRIMVLAGRGRRRGPELLEQLENLALMARKAGLHEPERTARWLLSVVTEESGDIEAARSHSLDAEEAGRQAEPRVRLEALANTARCLVQLEREPERAKLLLAEAEDLSRTLGTPVLDIPWGYGLLHAMEGRPDAARDALEKGATMARGEENHWALFECLSRLSMLDVAAGNLAPVEDRDGELRDIADKLGEGSERALAATLLALARRKSGIEDHGLEAALDQLRAADSKGLLAYALNEAGRMDLAEGNAVAAGKRAGEALDAATEVDRLHQSGRAIHLMEEAKAMED